MLYYLVLGFELVFNVYVICCKCWIVRGIWFGWVGLMFIFDGMMCDWLNLKEGMWVERIVIIWRWFIILFNVFWMMVSFFCLNLSRFCLLCLRMVWLMLMSSVFLFLFLVVWCFLSWCWWCSSGLFKFEVSIIFDLLGVCVMGNEYECFCVSWYIMMCCCGWSFYVLVFGYSCWLLYVEDFESGKVVNFVL